MKKVFFNAGLAVLMVTNAYSQFIIGTTSNPQDLYLMEQNIIETMRLQYSANGVLSKGFLTLCVIEEDGGWAVYAYTIVPMTSRSSQGEVWGSIRYKLLRLVISSHSGCVSCPVVNLLYYITAKGRIRKMKLDPISRVR